MVIPIISGNNLKSLKIAPSKSILALKYQKNTDLTCDVCSSNDIIETIEGYVCRDCGIVLEIQKLEYYRPYNDDIIQYAVLGTTQIGSKRERLSAPKSNRLEKLNKLQSIKENKENVLHKARIEISRIFNCLELPESKKEFVFTKFKKFRDALSPGTKYRSPEKLVPLVIYFSFKAQNISINEAELLGYSKITKKEYNAFKLQINNFEPKYHERNRKDYIIQKIMELTEHFDLGMPFYYQSKKILYRLWESIKCTKDDVVAGLVSSISILCSYRDKVNVNSLCKRLGIKMSTIQSQVKRRIFERLRIGGFVSLVKSSDLLKKIISRMGLIEIEEPSVAVPACVSQATSNPIEIDTILASEIIQIDLGNAVNIFNGLDDIDYYIYALRDEEGFPLYVSLKLFNSSENYSFQGLTEIIEKENLSISDDKLFELEFLRLYSGKGPPF